MTNAPEQAPLWSVPTIVELMLECGHIARHYFRQPGIGRLKPDQSLVTPADEAIEQALARVFDHPETGNFLLGEETVETRSDDYIDAAFRHNAWVVDPIDGTAPFVNGFEQWGTSIGLMQHGQLTEGAIFLPCRGELFISSAGQVLHAAAIGATTTPAAVALKPLPRVDLEPTPGAMVALSQVAAKGFLFKAPNPVQATGCAVTGFMDLLLGRYLAYISHIKLWDLAGSLPMLMAHGYTGVFLDGQPLTATVDDAGYVLQHDSDRRYYLREGCLFARSAVIPQVLSCFEESS